MAKFQSFEEFWPYYVKAHSKKLNRTLHFLGLSLAMGCGAMALLTRQKKWLVRAPLLGYPISWIGHFFVEGNTPATFGHPLWSLQADLRMWYKTITGTMDAEVERVLQEEASAVETSTTARPVDPNVN